MENNRTWDYWIKKTPLFATATGRKLRLSSHLTCGFLLALYGIPFLGWFYSLHSVHVALLTVDIVFHLVGVVWLIAVLKPLCGWGDALQDTIAERERKHRQVRKELP